MFIGRTVRMNKCINKETLKAIRKEQPQEFLWVKYKEITNKVPKKIFQ